MPVPVESDFFIYPCDHCGAGFCERVNLMNLALDYVESAYCLDCLARMHEMNPAELANFAQAYVHARECFKTPWDNEAAHAAQCPRLPESQCHCQDLTP